MSDNLAMLTEDEINAGMTIPHDQRLADARPLVPPDEHGERVMGDAKIPKCDRCEKPATMTMFVEWTPLAVLHYGCDDHPVQGEEYFTHMPPRRTS